ncbi:MAG: hypothetical protein ISS17_05505 [Bacteroidales bacterium]|nr:hypothetical protein [Bacteroidales bacterium]
MQEKLSQTKQVITLQDVNEVIEVMGQPSQFAEEDTSEGETGAAESVSIITTHTETIDHNPIC